MTYHTWGRVCRGGTPSLALRQKQEIIKKCEIIDRTVCLTGTLIQLIFNPPHGGAKNLKF